MTNPLDSVSSKRVRMSAQELADLGNKKLAGLIPQEYGDYAGIYMVRTDCRWVVHNGQCVLESVKA